MDTELNDFVERGRAALVALAPIVAPGYPFDPADPESISEVVFCALVALVHVSRAAEVDFNYELGEARALVAGDLNEDAELRADLGADE